jgi:hypothetical protein
VPPGPTFGEVGASPHGPADAPAWPGYRADGGGPTVLIPGLMPACVQQDMQLCGDPCNRVLSAADQRPVSTQRSRSSHFAACSAQALSMLCAHMPALMLIA